MDTSPPLLTIAIPTYNRSARLAQQIKRLVNSIGEQWAHCRLLILDNASTDDTPAVCQAWQAQLGARLRVVRQPRNLGLIGNLCSCIRLTDTPYLWTVSDDDPIRPQAVANVLRALWDNPDVGFVHLNYETTNGYDGDVVQARVYPFDNDQRSAPGEALFIQCLTQHEIFMSCLTAMVLRSDLARQALASWPAGERNIALPVYLGGYAALHAPMVLSASVSLSYPLHTMSHVKRWLVTVYLDLPDLYLHLAQQGCNPAALRGLIFGRISAWVFILRFPLEFLRSLPVYLSAMRLPHP